MQHKLVLESSAKISETAKIRGIALIPRISRNGNLYTKEEIRKAHNKTVPLNWEHESDKVIGEVRFLYNEELEQLFYEGAVTDPAYAQAVRNKNFHTSIEADVGSVSHICNGPGDCFAMPKDLNFKALALVAQPGVPETGVTVIESLYVDGDNSNKCSCSKKDKKCDCEKQCLNTTSESKDIITMTKDDKKEQGDSCPVGQKMVDGKCVEMSKDEKKEALKKLQEQLGPDSETAGIDQAKPDENPCGEGMKLVDGKCVPADNDVSGVPGGSSAFDTTEAKKDGDCGCSKGKGKTEEATGHGMPNMDDISAALKEQKEMISDMKARINNPTQLNELEEMQKFNTNLYKTAQIGTKGGNFANDDIASLAQEGRQSLKKFGNYSFDINMSNDWVRENVLSVSEALTYTDSGDPSNKRSIMDKIFVLPGGKYAKSIRDLVRFKEIENGTDQIKFIKGSIPDRKAITEGSDNSDSAHNLDVVPLTADDVTGVPQTIKQSEIEDSPQEIFSYLAETARAEVLDSEAKLVFNSVAGKDVETAANVNSTTAQNAGGYIEANTSNASKILSPTAAKGDITSTAAAMNVDTVAAVLKYYEDQQYDTSFGNIKLMLHTQAMRELRTDSNIERFIQVGDANITKTGKLTHLFGVELIPSPVIPEVTSGSDKAYRNAAFVGGHTFALASKRELTIDLQKRPNKSAYEWMWTQRKNATVFDGDSWVRVLTDSA